MDSAIFINVWALLGTVALASALIEVPMVVNRALLFHADTQARASVKLIFGVIAVYHLVPASAVFFLMKLVSPNKLAGRAGGVVLTGMQGSLNYGDCVQVLT